jgi:hypothetical protein
MRTDVTLEFADGEFRFHLSVMGILELQEKTKTGIAELFARVSVGRYVDGGGKPFGFPLDGKFYLTDLTETIRLGLIGGGMDPVEAKRRVDRYCYPAQPLKGTWDLAAAILLATMEGYEEPKEEAGSKKKGTTKAKGGSTPQPSSPT